MPTVAGTLAITETAAQAINSIVTSNDMPEGSSLRNAAQGDSAQREELELSVAASPSESDALLRDGGATAFLEPAAAEVLDKVLDVQAVTENGEEQL